MRNPFTRLEDPSSEPLCIIQLKPSPRPDAKIKSGRNGVATAKYNTLTFLPKFLLEQFMRLANFYFLVISIIQMSSEELAPTGQYYTFFPLMIILALTAVKELVEDLRRHRQDNEVNNKKALVLQDHPNNVSQHNIQAFQNRVEEVSVLWRHLQPGQLVKVMNKEAFPADLLLLASSEDDVTCYVETSSLDGETNLKMKKGLHQLAELQTPAAITALQGSFEYEAPNNSLYTFEGTLNLEHPSQTIPVGPEQVLLRGSSLRNTDWIIGLVIFTGHNSKLMRNAKSAPIKRSRMERMVNKQILAIFALLFTMALTCLVGFLLWNSSNVGHNAWYLYLSASTSAKDAVKQFVIFVVMFNTVVPISLYVSIEFVKLIQAYFINNDLDMYYREEDIPAVARTSNLNEELGQVDFVFTDKTGTLTRNQMRFKSCTVAGVKYGAPAKPERLDRDPTPEVDDDGRSQRSRQTLNDPESRSIVADSQDLDAERQASPTSDDPHYDFHDPALLDNLKQGHPSAAYIDQFLTALAVCHTVVLETHPSRPGAVEYRASSPDEVALVSAASYLEYPFLSRKPTRVVTGSPKGPLEYELLDTIEFDSARKRMSVVVRTPAGKLVLFCKGADSVIWERLRPSQDHIAETEFQLKEFAEEGLRTLCISKRDLSEEEYAVWAADYRKACASLENRKERIDAEAEKIERDLVLLGATAIEDRLQEGVPETIANLLSAGIRVWMLTGDKLETAINIGKSCELIKPDMEVLICEDNSEEAMQAWLSDQISHFSSDDHRLALVIEGHTLVTALGPTCRQDFVRLAVMSRVCVCCRVSPIQKAEVVVLVKESLNCITLAIGDGANDVSMIQSADVGIGISGLEGLQAARSADYAIGQFRFLKKLLFVHGAWSYRRLAKMILYSFYKTLTLYLVSFYFTFLNGFSGQIPWDKLSNAGWNMAFTSLPVIAMGLFEQDVSKVQLMRYPRLYLSGQHNTFFNLASFFGWFFTSIYHSLLIFLLVSQGIYTDPTSPEGWDGNIYLLGTVAYCCVLITVTGKISLMTSYWTVWNHVVIWGSLLLYFLMILLFGSSYFGSFGDGASLYEISTRLLTSGQFYMTIILVPFACLLRDLAWRFYQRSFRPQDYHIAQEIGKVSLLGTGHDFLLREKFEDKDIFKNIKLRQTERAPLVDSTNSGYGSR